MFESERWALKRHFISNRKKLKVIGKGVKKVKTVSRII